MKVILKVKGMHCDSCEKLICMAAEEIPGIENIQVNYKQGIVKADCANEQCEQALKQAIEKEGYTVI